MLRARALFTHSFRRHLSTMGIETFEALATKPAGGAAAEALLKIDRSRDLLAALPDDNAKKSVWKYFLALTETPRLSGGNGTLLMML